MSCHHAEILSVTYGRPTEYKPLSSDMISEATYVPVFLLAGHTIQERY